MRFQVHALSGAAVAGLVCRALPTNELTLCAITAGMVIGSVIPDIDSTKSKVSDAGPISGSVSILAETTFGHRGFFHTPACVLLLTLLWLALLGHFDGSLGPQMLIYHFGLSFLVGYALHIFVDMFSSFGIMLLWPFLDKRFSFKHTAKIGSIKEARIFAILMLLVIAIFVIPSGITPAGKALQHFAYELLRGCKFYALRAV